MSSARVAPVWAARTAPVWRSRASAGRVGRQRGRGARQGGVGCAGRGGVAGLGSGAGVGDVAWSGPFGGGDDVLAVDPGDGAVDVHDPGVEVEVFAAEFGDLSEPSAAPGGEQDNGLSS